MNTYILKPRVPPVLWVAGGVAVVGLLLVAGAETVLASATLRWIGIVVVVLGLAAILTSVLGMRHARVWVTFDEEGYTIEGPRGEFSGSWLDITDVKVARRSAKIAIFHGPGRRVIIAHPAGRPDEVFMQVREGIRRHLEATLPGDAAS